MTDEKRINLPRRRLPDRCRCVDSAPAGHIALALDVTADPPAMPV